MRYHPDATLDPVPGHPGKPWSGGNGRTKLVLHTLEYTRWPNPDGTWACPHLTYNPWTRELRQHVPFDRAAYSLRDNTDEDDKYTYQVEMWGRAAEVPNYGDDWYAGVASLIQWFIDHQNLEPVFVDRWLGAGSGAASSTSPVRMTQQEWDVFSGICGHQHFGRGIDTHWDPGALDITRIETYLTGDIMDTATWASTHRDEDIARLVEVHVLTAPEQAYWTGLLHRAQDPQDTDVTWEYAEWQDLRNAVDVRLRYWKEPS